MTSHVMTEENNFDFGKYCSQQLPNFLHLIRLNCFVLIAHQLLVWASKDTECFGHRK